MKKRRSFSAEFKAKVALEALAGEKTLSELASQYQVHPNVIANWKKQAQQGMVDTFSGKQNNSKKSNEDDIKDLHAKIGQLTIENDFLQKAFARR
jgi:transposase